MSRYLWRCPNCWRGTSHPDDLANEYCGFCLLFTGDGRPDAGDPQLTDLLNRLSAGSDVLSAYPYGWWHVIETPPVGIVATTYGAHLVGQVAPAVVGRIVTVARRRPDDDGEVLLLRRRIVFSYRAARQQLLDWMDHGHRDLRVW